MSRKEMERWVIKATGMAEPVAAFVVIGQEWREFERTSKSMDRP
jgi:hypothetical protein